MARSSLIVLPVLIAFMCVSCEGSRLRNHFYKKSCPSAEPTIRNVVKKYIAKDRTLAAPLLRMNFHDCFVRGCDGSVLVNSTVNNAADKEAFPNLSLRGYEVIDEAKEEIEKRCPGVVSCADILALVTRDAVVAGSGGPFWRVRTGRRDGIISRENELLTNIPSPFSNFSVLQTSFARKGLNVKDLVVLSGAHSIGRSLCNFFSGRLYNFTGKGDTDPSLDPAYANFLKKQCTSQENNTASVAVDPTNSLTFDSVYFTNLKSNMGLFQTDAALLTNYVATKLVDNQVNKNMFFKNFKHSMQKMSEIEVLTGTAGQIRRHCALLN